MECQIALRLYQTYVRAGHDFATATDKLNELIGKHEEFAEELQKIAILGEECEIWRAELERHWGEHNCRRWHVAKAAR